MGRIFAVATVALLIGLQSHPAAASEQTGNTLLTDCGTGPIQDAAPTLSTGMCVGYIGGSVDVLRNMGLLCLTPTTTNGQVVDIVVKYLVDHPEWRDKEAHFVVYGALKDVFPCPKTPKS
jgi:hypothetical protein